MLLSIPGVYSIVDEVVDVCGSVGVIDRLNEVKILTVSLGVQVVLTPYIVCVGFWCLSVASGCVQFAGVGILVVGGLWWWRGVVLHLLFVVNVVGVAVIQR